MLCALPNVAVLAFLPYPLFSIGEGALLFSIVQNTDEWPLAYLKSGSKRVSNRYPDTTTPSRTTAPLCRTYVASVKHLRPGFGKRLPRRSQIRLSTSAFANGAQNLPISKFYVMHPTSPTKLKTHSSSISSSSPSSRNTRNYFIRPRDLIAVLVRVRSADTNHCWRN